MALCHHRLNYLVPLPLLCAILPAAGPRLLGRAPGGPLGDRLLLASALLAVIMSFLYSYRALSITPISEQAGWKSPLEYQLVKENTDFARAAGKYIEHDKLLAPTWTAGCELALLFPEMKVAAPRFVTHYFTNAGNPEEGILRHQAQAFVEGNKSGNLQRPRHPPFRVRRTAPRRPGTGELLGESKTRDASHALNPFGLRPGVAEGDHIVGISDQNRRVRPAWEQSSAPCC